MPFLSIIAAYYQGVTDAGILQRFLDSLSSQTFKDFECLIYHDGPLLTEVSCPYEIRPTPTRANCWGHNLRALGLTQARGGYILHTNVDNVYDPNAFQAIFEKLRRTPVDILITQAVMMGLNRGPGRIWYDSPRDYGKCAILTGNPPVYGNVDLMQAVISKRIWDRYGWFSLVEQADGLIVSQICKENGYACSDIVIGRHY
jgi:hypothetical protein